MTRLTYSRPRSKDRPAYDRPLGNKVHEGRRYVRLQPTDGGLTRRRCEVPVPGATEGTVRRLPCNRKPAWYAIWTYENGAFRNSGYFCADHRPPVEATHRKGGVALDSGPAHAEATPATPQVETVVPDRASANVWIAFAAMREALLASIKSDGNDPSGEPCGCLGCDKARAALALADKISGDPPCTRPGNYRAGVRCEPTDADACPNCKGLADKVSR